MTFTRHCDERIYGPSLFLLNNITMSNVCLPAFYNATFTFRQLKVICEL